MKSGEPYRQYIPGTALSLQRNTANVPQDNYFYVIKDGEVVGRFKGLAQALQRYRSLREISTPPGQSPSAIDISKISREQQFIDKELYWAESYKFRRQGGKGGRGGV